jgi:predicted negative regulator of RcsB-dependent stress response
MNLANLVGKFQVPEHISRKELKQDRIRESIEHGAEAVISHGQFVSIVLAAAALAILGYFGWSFYNQRQTVKASAAFDQAMKAYSARIRAPNEPAEAGEVSYFDEMTKLEDAARKFAEVADKYPRTNPGMLARYYGALSLEEMGRFNQALEYLRKLENSSDKELAALARFQMAEIYARTDKPDDAIKIYRQLAERPTVFVPKPLVLLQLAGQLRARNPEEAAKIYNQIKQDYPDSALSEEAQRGLDSLPSKS